MKKSLALFFTLITTFSVVSTDIVKANTDTNPYTKGSVGREIRGSGYWSSSNIREWLNSDKATVKYTNNPPSSEFMGSKAYDKEAGFLNQFTEEEKQAIAISERRIWVNMGADEIAAEQKGEGLPHANIYAPGYLTNYPKFAFNYKNYANKKDNDKVFLLTPFEAYWYLNQRGFPYKRELTKEAKDKHNVNYTSIEWWLQGNTLWQDWDNIYLANTSNQIYYTDAWEDKGIVPAINIKPNYTFKDGRLASNLKIGEEVVFGTYLNAPITWQVINISDSGYPMLLSKYILDLKRYDAPGDQSKQFSEYVKFDVPDISLYDDVQYKPTNGGSDVSLPVVTITNIDELNKRQNGQFTLNFTVSDDGSGIKYVKLPDGTITSDTNLSYTFKKNSSYLIGVMDNSGNYLDYMIPVSNINEEPVVLIKPSTESWTNQNVVVDISASNDVKYSGKLRLNNTTEWGSPLFPNYVSYSGARFRVKGVVKLTYCAEEGRNLRLGIGYSYRGKKLSPYTHELYGSWRRVLDIYYDDFVRNNGTVPFDFEFEVPEDYSQNLQGWIHTGLNQSLGKVVEFEFVDLEYSLVDKGDFEITGIKLPNGNTINNKTSYQDTLSTEGVNKYIYTVIDNRGKETSRGITAKIDKTKPAVEVDGLSDVITNQNVTLNFHASDALSGIKQIVTPKATHNFDGSKNVDFTYIAEANGVIPIRVVDLAGNETTLNINITNIDKDKPSISATGIQEDNWTKGWTDVNLYASDSHSGVNKIEYRLSGATQKGWSVYSDKITITNSGLTQIDFRATDNVGNVSDIISRNIKIDNIAPSVKISASDEIFNRNLNISLSEINDSLSGVSKIRLSNSSSFDSYTEFELNNVSSKNIIFELDKKNNQLENFGERNVYVKLYDNAGNVNNYTITTILHPNGETSVSILKPINNLFFMEEKPISIYWRINSNNTEFPNLEQKKGVIRAVNLDTDETYTYNFTGNQTKYTLMGLPKGSYRLYLSLYISDYSNAIETSVDIRVGKFLQDGNVFTKTINAQNAIKFVTLQSEHSIPVGADISVNLYYKNDNEEFNNSKKISLGSLEDTSMSIPIRLPEKSSSIKIDFVLTRGNSEFATPMLDSIIVLAK